MTQEKLEELVPELAPDPRATLVMLAWLNSPVRHPTSIVLYVDGSSQLIPDNFDWIVEHPLHRDALLRVARPGVKVKVALLPEDSRAEGRFAVVERDAFQTAAWGLLDLIEDTRGSEIRTATRPATTGPSSPFDDRRTIRMRTNELLVGEPVWVFDSVVGAMLVKSSTGYLDYIQESRVRFVTEPEFVAAMNPLRSAETLVRIDRAIAHARARLGQPYIWGGRGATGADCSGLTQTAFAAAGVHIPRDADQQSVVGKLVATRWFRDALQSGDLLFFLSAKRGDVNHVAIYLGNGRYIESADGGVKIRSMDPADPTYDAKRMSTFAWARRVLE